MEKTRLDKALGNNEIKAMLTAFGCGFGEEFDESKLRYHRIVCMTDADVDGAHIRILMLTFFYRYMRPLVEKGWNEVTRQIGLSGRTVKPKLIITCGVSGAVQFAAGMSGSECIVAINTDPEAPIFKIANYCIVKDLYEVVPQLTAAVRAKKG